MSEAEARKKTPGSVIYIRIMCVVNIALVAFIGVFLIVTRNKTQQPASPAANAEETVTEPEDPLYHPETAVASALSPTLNGVAFPAGILPEFQPIYSVNQDTVGWIKLPGTAIDYPVMQGPDNEKYVRHNFWLERINRGSIWMDFRNRVAPGRDSLSKVTIIYGHHLTSDETIFAELENYFDVEFYRTHPVIEMNTIYGRYKWKVFGCFVSNVEGQHDNGHVFYYWDPNITDGETVPFVQEILRRSWFINPTVDVQSTDKLLCLSTCTYIMNKPKYVEMRCVVMARLVREGEDETVDVASAFQNENRRMPQLWYTQNSMANPYKDTPVFNDLT